MACREPTNEGTNERSGFRWRLPSLILGRRSVDGTVKRANGIRNCARDSLTVFIFITKVERATTNVFRNFVVFRSYLPNAALYFSFLYSEKSTWAGKCDVQATRMWNVIWNKKMAGLSKHYEVDKFEKLAELNFLDIFAEWYARCKNWTSPRVDSK